MRAGLLGLCGCAGLFCLLVAVEGSYGPEDLGQTWHPITGEPVVVLSQVHATAAAVGGCLCIITAILLILTAKE